MKTFLQNIVRLKEISTKKDFRFGTFPFGFGLYFLPTTDRSLVDCLCECADNISKGNVPLTKPQKEKLKRNKAGLRALMKKSVSLKKKKAILQKGRFVGSLLAPLTGNLFLLISPLILRCFAKTFSFIVYFYTLETHRL
jgi:hypothetical protein